MFLLQVPPPVPLRVLQAVQLLDRHQGPPVDPRLVPLVDQRQDQLQAPQLDQLQVRPQGPRTARREVQLQVQLQVQRQDRQRVLVQVLPPVPRPAPLLVPPQVLRLDLPLDPR